MRPPNAASDHFLDTLPFDLSRPGAQELLGILAAVYWKSSRVVALLQKTGISPGTVNFDQPMDLALAEILTVARNRERLRALVDQVLADPEAEGWHGRLRALLADEPVARAEEPAPREGRPPLVAVASPVVGLRRVAASNE